MTLWAVGWFEASGKEGVRVFESKSKAEEFAARFPKDAGATVWQL